MAAEEAKPGEEKMKVRILSREEITTYPKIKTPVKTIAVTVHAPGYPPFTLFIPKDEWSKEKERELIKQKLEELKKRQVEEVEL